MESIVMDSELCSHEDSESGQCYHACVKILGCAFLLLGTLSIIYNKHGAHAYAEFQKGWGLAERKAILIGRLLGLLGGLLFVGLGLLIILK